MHGAHTSRVPAASAVAPEPSDGGDAEGAPCPEAPGVPGHELVLLSA